MGMSKNSGREKVTEVDGMIKGDSDRGVDRVMKRWVK